MPSPGLRSRLLIALATLLGVVLLLLGLMLVDEAQRRIDENRLAEATHLARTLAVGSVDGLVAEDYELLTRWTESVLPSKHYAYAALVRPNGQVLTHTDVNEIGRRIVTQKTPAGNSTRNTTYRQHAAMEVTVPVTVGGKHFANAHVAYFLDQEDLLRNEAAARIAWPLALTLLGLFVAVGLVARWVTKPIESLTRSIGDATPERALCVDPRVSARTDEVGALARAFAELSSRLAESFTALKTANEELEQRVATRTRELDDSINYLHESRARIGAIMDNVADAIITIDERGLIESFNWAATRIFGYEPAEAIGCNVGILMPEPHRGRHDAYLSNYLETGEHRILGRGPREMVAQRKDGTSFPADIAISEVRTGAQRLFIGIVRDITERQALMKRLETEAHVDALTGLNNRRMFDRRLEEENRRAQRYDKPYALLMLDIDHFKRINDEYGHPAGDAVLAALGQILTLQVREVDTVARFGGEEFAVIFPEISGSVAKDIGERMRHAIAGKSFSLPDGRQIGVTVSIGISCFPNCATDAQTAVSTADQALYIAKQAGRNRVLLYRETLKARLEKNPDLVVELLNESLDHALPIATAVSTIAPFLRQHSERVRQTTELLANMMKLSPEDRETLRLAALLHDIGMLTIPGSVLNKPTPLTPDEQKLIQQHPVTAAKWLACVPALQTVAPLVRHHHERYDGQGYPDGLRGDAIPPLARALTLADAYASMISDWPGRHALEPHEVLVEIKAGAGSQFDPVLAEQFLRALA